jgi:transcriptional regulator with XRE-family HTH domain
MLETFGARLRRRREEQAIALATIAEQTKIKLSLLDALERDDVSHWPSGIFRRAFIRAYADAINLNPDVVVREFFEVHPEPADVIATTLAIASAADATRTNGGPPTRLRTLVGSAIGSLSRLRRGGVGGDLTDGESAPAGVPAVRPPEVPAVAYQRPEPRHVETTERVVSESVPARTPASPEPETAAVVVPGASTDGGRAAAMSEAAGGPVNGAESYEPDFMAAAELCTELGRVESAGEVQPLLQQAADILDAIGLIVWVWDALAEELSPALAHGYSDKVLAQLPTVRREADNATAAAFRAARTCAIKGSDHDSAALAVPLLTPAGCAGVLAIELPNGSEQAEPIRAVATIFAALLAQLIGGAQPAAVRPQPEEPVRPVGNFATPALRVRR